MWQLFLTAKTTATRPSDLVGLQDRWAALQFDNAVCLVGSTIENALEALERRGPEDAPRYEPKYKLSDLLDPNWHFPPEEIMPEGFDIVEGMKFDTV